MCTPPKVAMEEELQCWSPRDSSTSAIALLPGSEAVVIVVTLKMEEGWGGGVLQYIHNQSPLTIVHLLRIGGGQHTQ